MGCDMKHISLTLVVLFLAASVPAQQSGSGEATQANPYGISSLHFKSLARERHILVYFTAQTAGDRSDINPAEISIRFLPSKKRIPQNSITGPNPPDTTASSPATHFVGPFGNQVLQIGLIQDDSTRPEPGDTQVEIAIQRIHFADGKLAGPVTGLGAIYDKANIQELVDLTRKALASAKTKEEKNQFVGLGIAIPSPASSTSGNTDISFNRDFYSGDLAETARRVFDSGSVGFVLKKGNEEKSDPRHFEAGLKLRKVFLLVDRRALETIRRSIASGEPSPTAATLDALTHLQRNFLRGIIWDNGSHFEGDVKEFKLTNVSNLVYDTVVQAASVSRGFSGQTGFWNFRLMPVGLELGHNLTAEQTANAERGSLARFKTGAQVNLHYQAKGSVHRVEFEALSVHRYLFEKENAVDPKTNKAVATTAGNKNWFEADLRFFFGLLILKNRPGLKVSYQRGYLPPTYSFTKSFNVGIVFESADDDTSGR
jgi:hypothetical protein